MVKEVVETLNLIDEHQTRKKCIDPVLKQRGWLEKYIKEEINSVKSNFKEKSFLPFAGVIEKGVDRFIDYVLLDEDNSVLAIIESKRFSVDEDKGRIQARTYAKDIEKQINKKVPIFLTNGHKWLFIDGDGIERVVSGPFSQEDLRRRGDLYSKQRDPKEVNIDERIVDRPRSVQIVRELSEHFSEGHRKALIHMATGTGKTRVAMALINLLINSNVVRNVLFIADRIALVNQAKAKGFKQFFTEPVSDLRQGFTTTGRLYVSTVQTLIGRGKNRLFEKFSPGFFDLIVFDEAHRSIYDKNNLINLYFDAIKIGLTATPRGHETKNTYDLFGCEQGTPTVEYSYDEAVLDGVLVPYSAEIIETKILSLGIKGQKLTADLKDQLRRQEEDPEALELSGGQFDRVFMDDKTNELVIREFMNRCYKSDEGKPAKSIFFCASQRHAKHVKKIFGKMFPKLGNEVQVITSDMARAEDEVVRFEKESEPRIALSVGMLDTGIDVPEICNLVFVKPVFSHIRFWQMVGRGTRNLNACKHRTWLPGGEKKEFEILDFKVGGHSNVKYHEFKEAKERSSKTKDTITRTFENRVNLLKKPLDSKQNKIIHDKLLHSINSLDENSFIVREKQPVLKKLKSQPFELKKYIKELQNEVAPLMFLNQGKNAKVSSFILHTERAFGYILDKRKDKIENVKEYVQEMVENIFQRDNLTEIQYNRDNILSAMQEDFWGDLTFEDVEFLVKEIAPLMKYFQPNPRKVMQIDAPDLVLSAEKFKKEIKEDETLTEFLKNNLLVKKIKEGGGVTAPELKMLEQQLVDLRPELTIKNVQEYQKRDFLLFLRDIIGLSYSEDPKELIEKRVDEFIIEKNHYNSKQLEFLRLLKKVFSERKCIELKDLAKPPLSEVHPLDYFQIDELKLIIEQCNQIKMK